MPPRRKDDEPAEADEVSQDTGAGAIRTVEPKVLEDFVGDYLKAYRDYLASLDTDERHLPQFYKGFPYTAEIYALPNGAACALFKKSNRTRFTAAEGDFQEVLARVKAQDFDFMLTFPPFTSFDADEAERLARLDADRDLKTSRRLELLSAAESHMEDIRREIDSMVELNPWLDAQAAAQKEKLERARELITELYRAVDLDREERFAEYSRMLTELMAFEAPEMEELASEVQIQMEEALEEFDARLAGLESGMEGMEAIGSEVKALDTALKDLARDMRELNLKLKDAGGGKELDSMETAITKMQGQIKDLKSQVSGLKKDVGSLKGELSISKEIKDTVFRDSKRAHNLNERVTDLEGIIKKLEKSGPAQASEVKALEAKINILEKNLKDYVRDYTRRQIKKEIAKLPPPPAPEPPVEEAAPPRGATVKKTTRKTTKKTTRKK